MADAPPPTPLRQAAVAGVKWTSAAAAVGVAVGVVQPLILVRLLEPRDFGLMAAVLVVVGFTQGFADAGISSALTVRRRLPPEGLSSLFWANALVGLALFGALYALAPLVARFYGGHDEIVELTRWAAVAFLVTPTATIPKALLERELRFDAVARAEMCGALASLAAAVTAAALGAGALALVWGWLAGVVVRCALIAVAGARLWSLRLRLRPADLRGYLGFGAYQMGERSIAYLANNVDYVVIGRFLGPEALGVYSIAYQVVVRPVTQLNPVVMRVATPVLARLQDDDAALRRGFAEAVRTIALVTMPLLVGVAIVADAFVPALLGPGWAESTTLIQILAPVGLVKTVTNPIGAVFLAKQRPDIGFKLVALVLPALALLLWAVVDRGVEAVAWASLGFFVALALVVTPWLMWRTIRLRPTEYAAALRPPVALTAGMAAVAVPVALALDAAGAPPGVRLAVTAAAGAAAYAALALRLEGDLVRELWRMLRGRRAPAAAA